MCVQGNAQIKTKIATCTARADFTWNPQIVFLYRWQHNAARRFLRLNFRTSIWYFRQFRIRALIWWKPCVLSIAAVAIRRIRTEKTSVSRVCFHFSTRGTPEKKELGFGERNQLRICRIPFASIAWKFVASAVSTFDYLWIINHKQEEVIQNRLHQLLHSLLRSRSLSRHATLLSTSWGGALREALQWRYPKILQRRRSHR